MIGIRKKLLPILLSTGVALSVLSIPQNSTSVSAQSEKTPQNLQEQESSIHPRINLQNDNKKEPLSNEQKEKIKKEMKEKAERTVLVTFKTDTNKKNVEKFFEQFPASSVEFLNGTNQVILTFDEKNKADNAFKGLKNAPFIEYIDFDGVYEAELEYVQAPPNDSEFSQQYYLQSGFVDDLDGMFNHRKYRNVTVAVIDTGFTKPTDILSSKIVNPYDAYNNDYDPKDANGHGTKVASLIASTTNNNYGMASVTGDYGVKITPIQVTNDNGSYNTFDMFETAWIRALNHAIEKKVDVITTSVTVSQYDVDKDLLMPNAQIALDRAYAAGIIIIASGGNDNRTFERDDRFPSGEPETWAIAANNRYKNKTSFSNYGSLIRFVAPGDSILVGSKDNEFNLASGTSFSAPMAAAVVANMIATSPSHTSESIYNALRDTAENINADESVHYQGSGMIRADKALIEHRLKDFTAFAHDFTVPTKTWNINLSQQVDPTSLKQVFVLDANRNKVPTNVTLTNGGLTVSISPKTSYAKGKYILVVADLKNLSGIYQKENVYKPFTVQ